MAERGQTVARSIDKSSQTRAFLLLLFFLRQVFSVVTLTVLELTGLTRLVLNS